MNKLNIDNETHLVWVVFFKWLYISLKSNERVIPVYGKFEKKYFSYYTLSIRYIKNHILNRTANINLNKLDIDIILRVLF